MRLQVHTININPDTGEAKILLVGVEKPFVTTIPQHALQAVLAGVAAVVLEQLLPGYKPAPGTTQTPQNRQRHTARRAEIVEPDDDPTPDDDDIAPAPGDYDFGNVADEIESTLMGLFDEDTDIVVTPVTDSSGGHVVVTISSPDGTRKGGTFRYNDWIRDQCSIRPFLSVITGRSL